jgi:hypothetical protein
MFAHSGQIRRQLRLVVLALEGFATASLASAPSVRA